MSNQPADQKGGGIRLPPISFLGGLNSNSTANSTSSQSVTEPTTSRLGSSGFQLPRLGHEQLERIKMEGEEHQPLLQRAVYNLPTPMPLGIDVRRQNLSNEDQGQDPYSQPQELYQQPQEPPLVSKTSQVSSTDSQDIKKAKEERKRRNKEKRDKDKLLKLQQQSLQEQQYDLDRRQVVEEHERYTRGTKDSASELRPDSPVLVSQPGKHSYDDTHEERIPFKRQVTTINNLPVLEDAEIFPRRHLGSILYQQFPTKTSVVRKLRLSKDHEHRLQEDDLEYKLYLLNNKTYLKNKPAKIINLLPPYLKYYINSLVDIKISHKDLIANENVYKRSIWGTDVYTDDSDIVAMLYHCGIIHSKSPFGELNEASIIPRTPGNRLDLESVQNSRDPYTRSEGGDLTVTLLILPALNNYQGSFRNNYNSRSWMSTHDGGSIAIYNVKWCNLGDSYQDNNYLDIKRVALTDNALMRLQVQEDEKLARHISKDPNWTVQGSNVDRLLNDWNFDKSVLKSFFAADQDSKRQDQGNDTTILLNQTTQIHHTDDTTIQDITKHDDTTIDDHQ